MLFHLKTLIPLKVFFFQSRKGRVIKLPAYRDNYVLLTDDNEENPSYCEAMKSSLKNAWFEAIRKQYNALIENKTWMLPRFPRAEKQVDSGWLSKLGDTTTNLLRNSLLVS